MPEAQKQEQPEPASEEEQAHLSFERWLHEPLELLHLTLLLNHPMTKSVAKAS